jgi:serine/threonine-protein kinase
VLGTPLYMAPEQADAKANPVGPQSDLFALGLISFRLLVGVEYWGTGTLKELLARILVRPMDPASARGSTLGPEFDAWFARACCRESAGRFTSAHEQVEALAQALELPVISQRAASDPGKTPKSAAREAVEGAPTLAASVQSARAVSRSGRSRGAIAMGVALAAFLGVGSWLVTRGSSRPAAGGIAAAAAVASSAAPPVLSAAISVPSSGAPPPTGASATSASAVASAMPLETGAPAASRLVTGPSPRPRTSATPTPSATTVDPFAGQN